MAQPRKAKKKVSAKRTKKNNEAQYIIRDDYGESYIGNSEQEIIDMISDNDLETNNYSVYKIEKQMKIVKSTITLK